MIGAVLAAAALAGDPGALAPGPAELREALARADRTAQAADAVAEALARAHNAWALAAPGRDACADPALASLAARSAVLGAALRDAAQSTRQDAARLQRIAASPTLAPLVGDELAAAVAARVAHAEDLAGRFAEMSSFHASFVAPKARACVDRLDPAPGLPRAEPRADGEGVGPVAVIAVGGGRLCPADLPADGRVVVLEAGLACYGEADCGCAPAPALPGAVIGPSTR